MGLQTLESVGSGALEVGASRGWRTMKQQPHNNDLKVGSRFRLSALGIERCRKFKIRTGVISGLSQTGSSVRVIFEGRRQPITLHQSYVESDSERSAPLGGVLHSQTVR
jgi:hypothetical protein